MKRALCLAMLLAVGCRWGKPAHDSGTPAPTPSIESTAPLDALSRRFGRVRNALRKRGYREVQTLPREFALEGTGVAKPLDLPTGSCSTVAALGGGGLRDLRLTLYDASGAAVAADSANREGALVHVCPQGEAVTLPYYLVFEAHEGSGAIAAALFNSPPGTGEGFEGIFDGVLAPQVPFRQVEERLAQSRAAMRERGLVPVGKPHLEVLAEGDVYREPVQLESGRCYVAVARGGTGLQDVDLFLYSPEGAEVARDLESDADPSLEHCPEETGRYIYEVRAFEGAGAIGLMIMSGPRPTSPPDAGTASSGDEATSQQPAPPPASGATGLTKNLTARGYEPVFVLREGTITPGEVRTHEVLIGPGCSVVVGAPGRTGTDLDLYLSDGDGHMVDRDARVEPSARVSACDKEAKVMRIAVKAYGREAPYTLTVLHAPSDIQDLQALRLDEADAAFRARGYKRIQTSRISLARGGRVSRTLEVPAGRCVAVAAAGDAGVEDIDLFLRTTDGHLVASESGPAPWAAVSRCAKVAEQLQLDVVMYKGEGEVTLVNLEGAP